MNNSSILIVGNVIKDVYLRLDEEQNDFEYGEGGTAWLNLSFNGGTCKYFRRSEFLGGAATALEIFSKFGISSAVAGSRATFNNGAVTIDSNMADDEHRYILCKGNDVCYLTSDIRKKSSWVAPNFAVNWIYIDRACSLTAEVAQGILAYLSISKQTRLAMYAPKAITEVDKRLLDVAHLIFTDDNDLDEEAYQGMVCFINDHVISMNGVRQPWQDKHIDMSTHLTSHTTIAATILSSITLGYSAIDALKFAKLNAENSSLNGSISPLNLQQLAEEQKDDTSDISINAASMVAAGKGILAADESGGSIHKKFEAMGIPDDEQHRRDYRNLFFTTPEIEKYVNGVILFEETANQKSDDGRNFVDYLTSKGIIPGIKVDQGLENFPDSDEKYTKGLEGLPERLHNYYDMGLRFAKWRAAFELTDQTPSDYAIQKNCEILAQYARDCQDAQIVPIVEPEVVYDGYYTIEKNAETTGKILDCLFGELEKAGVDLAGCILKCNMVLAGKKFETQSTPEEVGAATAEVLKAHVPDDLAGVVFLSGGQTVEQATENLQEVTNHGPFPWPVTFSYARALQDPALNAWQGNNDNADAARQGFKERLIANCYALEKHERKVEEPIEIINRELED